MTYNQVMNKIKKMNKLSEELGYNKVYIVSVKDLELQMEFSLKTYLNGLKAKGIKLAFENHTNWYQFGMISWFESYFEDGEKILTWEVKEL